MMGIFIEPIDDCTSWNILGFFGIDQFLSKTGILTTSETAQDLKFTKFSISPIVEVAVEVKIVNDLSKLVEGLKRLLISAPTVLIYMNEYGEHIVAGTGELHLEICLQN